MQSAPPFMKYHGRIKMALDVAKYDQPTPEFDREAWEEECWDTVMEEMPDASDAKKEAYFEELRERDWFSY